MDRQVIVEAELRAQAAEFTSAAHSLRKLQKAHISAEIDSINLEPVESHLATAAAHRERMARYRTTKRVDSWQDLRLNTAAPSQPVPDAPQALIDPIRVHKRVSRVLKSAVATATASKAAAGSDGMLLRGAKTTQAELAAAEGSTHESGGALELRARRWQRLHRQQADTTATLLADVAQWRPGQDTYLSDQEVPGEQPETLAQPMPDEDVDALLQLAQSLISGGGQADAGGSTQDARSTASAASPPPSARPPARPRAARATPASAGSAHQAGGSSSGGAAHRTAWAADMASAGQCAIHSTELPVPVGVRWLAAQARPPSLQEVRKAQAAAAAASYARRAAGHDDDEAQARGSSSAKSQPLLWHRHMQQASQLLHNKVGHAQQAPEAATANVLLQALRNDAAQPVGQPRQQGQQSQSQPGDETETLLAAAAGLASQSVVELLAPAGDHARAMPSRASAVARSQQALAAAPDPRWARASAWLKLVAGGLAGVHRKSAAAASHETTTVVTRLGEVLLTPAAVAAVHYTAMSPFSAPAMMLHGIRTDFHGALADMRTNGGPSPAVMASTLLAASSGRNTLAMHSSAAPAHQDGKKQAPWKPPGAVDVSHAQAADPLQRSMLHAREIDSAEIGAELTQAALPVRPAHVKAAAWRPAARGAAAQAELEQVTASLQGPAFSSPAKSAAPHVYTPGASPLVSPGKYSTRQATALHPAALSSMPELDPGTDGAQLSFAALRNSAPGGAAAADAVRQTRALRDWLRQQMRVLRSVQQEWVSARDDLATLAGQDNGTGCAPSTLSTPAAWARARQALAADLLPLRVLSASTAARTLLWEMAAKWPAMLWHAQRAQEQTRRRVRAQHSSSDSDEDSVASATPGSQRSARRRTRRSGHLHASSQLSLCSLSDSGDESRLPAAAAAADAPWRGVSQDTSLCWPSSRSTSSSGSVAGSGSMHGSGGAGSSASVAVSSGPSLPRSRSRMLGRRAGSELLRAANAAPATPSAPAPCKDRRTLLDTRARLRKLSATLQLPATLAALHARAAGERDAKLPPAHDRPHQLRALAHTVQHDIVKEAVAHGVPLQAPSVAELAVAACNLADRGQPESTAASAAVTRVMAAAQDALLTDVALAAHDHAAARMHTAIGRMSVPYAEVLRQSWGMSAVAWQEQLRPVAAETQAHWSQARAVTQECNNLLGARDSLLREIDILHSVRESLRSTATRVTKRTQLVSRGQVDLRAHPSRTLRAALQNLSDFTAHNPLAPGEALAMEAIQSALAGAHQQLIRQEHSTVSPVSACSPYAAAALLSPPRMAATSDQLPSTSPSASR